MQKSTQFFNQSEDALCHHSDKYEIIHVSSKLRSGRYTHNENDSIASIILFFLSGNHKYTTEMQVYVLRNIDDVNTISI